MTGGAGGRFLVGNGDVAADQTAVDEVGEEILGSFRLDGNAAIVALDIELFQPVAVDQR